MVVRIIRKNEQPVWYDECINQLFYAYMVENNPFIFFNPKMFFYPQDIEIVKQVPQNVQINFPVITN